MSRFVDVDLTDAPPAQGSAVGDKVPPGKYVIDIRNVSQEAARNTGRPMFTAILQIMDGEMKGKTLRDNFALPQTATDSKYGLQRFHAFLLALGLNITKAQFKLDLERLTGMRAVVDVYDDTLPPREGYAERIVSKVSAYFPVASANGASADKAPAATTQPELIAVGVGADEQLDAGEELDDLFNT